MTQGIADDTSLTFRHRRSTTDVAASGKASATTVVILLQLSMSCLAVLQGIFLSIESKAGRKNPLI